ncbi:hypothetical protein SFC88_10515 [Nocardioides sp. HM23]|uniref:hypothetical protein n=1 Tax=Nocardioides bizhenqiangii TaxID=3095076 RepID=UPI002ACAEA61|nr:hypothetical protein [Nocardioides sp. HM23]MDZ5621263.1 hypothetical protein [Nocardioides sp. HM23]
MLITVRRDSVHAADEPVDRELDLPPATTVDNVLRTLRPDVNVAGSASWLVRLGGSDGPAVAVYAVGFGMHVSPVAEQPVSSLSPPVIHFDYWQSSPPQLLLDALRRGEEPQRATAIEEGWRHQFRGRLAAARASEAEAPGGMLSPTMIAAASRLDARIEVHAADYARVVGADASAFVFRTDHRYWIWIDRVTDDDLELSIAWFWLPARAAEPVLAAILGTSWRVSRALPEPEPPPTTIEVLPGWRWEWRWADESGRHEVRNWDSPELAQRYAPFARLSVDEVVAHFTAVSSM